MLVDANINYFQIENTDDAFDGFKNVLFVIDIEFFSHKNFVTVWICHHVIFGTAFTHWINF